MHTGGPPPSNFHKSSYSANEAACVEVADLPSAAAVRDSQNPGLGHLEVPAAEWTALLLAASQP
ncbi:DUF397 domain-containing protein [Nocardiopsis sp. N85]|uniref:DUF397 domain-containing protein n=1 Tax=Nocardiopsis sp. N85 TaxID=3029400 RepID=UPI00237F8115|nr:DUF397 domain-containing protein [Nocardiopsis sp. N85]MDE3722729.1 DUF397 domain-containing protein [Nocardiopsis sp. N85]